MGRKRTHGLVFGVVIFVLLAVFLGVKDGIGFLIGAILSGGNMDIDLYRAILAEEP